MLIEMFKLRQKSSKRNAKRKTLQIDAACISYFTNTNEKPAKKQSIILKRSIVQPPKWFRPRNDPQPWNDPQIDPEMIPISLHVDPEMIPI